MEYRLLLGVLAGIAFLLVLILRFKIQAFLALLIASILTALLCGMESGKIMDTIQTGMGATLGFVATVVGLGSLFGAILEHSGGAQVIAAYLTRLMGEKQAPLAMTLTGFVVAIPVFFDVAFIILVPVLYALQQKTGRSLLLYAIPLLAGLATAHAFIPPTPGPIAVADILKVDLGWVILLGFFTGIPVILVSGLWFGKYISGKIHVPVPESFVVEDTRAESRPSVGVIACAIGIPLVLIVVASLVKSELVPVGNQTVQKVILLLGHPFVALILANLVVWYLLGIRRGVPKAELMTILNKSLAPAGSIILVTGAGGVFKQVLMDTGAGKMMAQSMMVLGLPVVVFAFLAAALIRVAQGSSTVAMITAAGLVSPLLAGGMALSDIQKAALVIAIASGASIASHVNDSGFWLVKQYLNLTEPQTFRSWTLMTTLLALTGFLGAIVAFYVTM